MDVLPPAPRRRRAGNGLDAVAMPGMTSARIRLGEESDIEPARAVLAAAYAEYEKAFPAESWAPYIKDILDLEGRAAESDLIVAEGGDSILGCVSYFPPGSKASYPADSFSEHWPDDWAAFRLLAVDPSARRRGVGRLLTEACVDRARDQGAPTLGLHTTEPMAVARAMYERMGFERIPRYDFRPSPTIVVEAYRLSLSGRPATAYVEPTAVFTTGRRLDAEMVRGMLNARGIGAWVAGGGMGAYRLESAVTEITGVPSPFNSYRVEVHPDDAEEAGALLDDVNARAVERDEDPDGAVDGVMSSLGARWALLAAAIFLLTLVVVFGPPDV